MKIYFDNQDDAWTIAMHLAISTDFTVLDYGKDTNKSLFYLEVTKNEEISNKSA